MRLNLLQRALRRRLLDPVRKRFALNRHDPLGQSLDFTELDAMAESLWGDLDLPVAAGSFMLEQKSAGDAEALLVEARRELDRLQDRGLQDRKRCA